jgi:hypothetical protein
MYVLFRYKTKVPALTKWQVLDVNQLTWMSALLCSKRWRIRTLGELMLRGRGYEYFAHHLCAWLLESSPVTPLSRVRPHCPLICSVVSRCPFLLYFVDTPVSYSYNCNHNLNHHYYLLSVHSTIKLQASHMSSLCGGLSARVKRLCKGATETENWSTTARAITQSAVLDRRSRLRLSLAFP